VATCVIWTVKGGSGVSTVAAGAAIGAARSGGALLVDLCGDQPALLGLQDRTGPGIAEWCRARDPRDDSLRRLERRASDGLDVLTAGDLPLPVAESWPPVAGALGSDPRSVVVDAGVVPTGPETGDARSILVVRSCYLALRRLVDVTHRPHGVVLVGEPGRALDRRDVERIAGAPVLAAPSVDAAIARRIDAGLILRRPPTALLAAGRRIW